MIGFRPIQMKGSAHARIFRTSMIWWNAPRRIALHPHAKRTNEDVHSFLIIGNGTDQSRPSASSAAPPATSRSDLREPSARVLRRKIPASTPRMQFAIAGIVLRMPSGS